MNNQTKSSTNDSKIAIICLVLTILVMVTAIIGVFFRGNMMAVEMQSVRGETYRMITNGIYRFNSERMVAEGVGWDIFTLFIACPVMLILVPFIFKGSNRVKILSIGILAYFFYQYLMYSVGWAFGPLLLPFIVIYSLSLFVALWILSTLDTGSIEEQIKTSFPRAGIITLCLVMAAMLILMWTRRIIAGLTGDLENAMLSGQTTLTVQALDLGLIVPFALITAILVWKRKALGYLLSVVLVVKGFAMAGAILSMVISAWIVEGKPEIVFLLVFLVVMVATGYLGILTIRKINT
jgi:hypothetical protein